MREALIFTDKVAGYSLPEDSEKDKNVQQPGVEIRQVILAGSDWSIARSFQYFPTLQVLDVKLSVCRK